MMINVRFVPMDPKNALFDSVVRLFSVTFFYDADRREKLREARQQLLELMRYPDFKGVTAIDETGEVIGFAYGFTSRPGQVFRKEMEGVLPPEEIKRWMSNGFHLGGLIVSKHYRRFGVGSAIYEALIKELPHETSILMIGADNIPAQNLFLKKGWGVIEDSITVVPGLEPQIIMGKVLKEKPAQLA